MKNVKQVAGGTVDPDEQHGPRTFERTQEAEGQLYMMTEIADGTFVQWLTCHACNKKVGECTCPGGPKEAPWLENSRSTRFEHSFGRRGALPALPESIKQRDRTVNAVMRHLIAKGFTITPPEVPVTADDIDFARETLGEDAPDDEVQDLAEQRVDRDAAEIVAASVDSGLDSALERVRQRTQEDDTDVGF